MFWGGAMRTLDARRASRGNRSMMRARARHRRRAEAARRSTRRSRRAARAISAAGRCRGARSTASSASPPRSCRRSAIAAPSIPVPFASARWGSLASFRAIAEARHQALVRQYGNSFVAVVEFGRASAPMRSPPAARAAIRDSPHFNDEAQRYASGDLRDGLFLCLNS